MLEFGGVGVVRAAARAQAVRAQIVIELADGLLVVIDQGADVQLGSSKKAMAVLMELFIFL
ncbi:hypothetical protein [Comamonas sp. A7-5]|uniref:hypothetical protein n=1 Tax=Comamonas sp. A7-5 TaxID=673549 RepID=UPI0031E3C241